jgi:hypothetical protein
MLAPDHNIAAPTPPYNIHCYFCADRNAGPHTPSQLRTCPPPPRRFGRRFGGLAARCRGMLPPAALRAQPAAMQRGGAQSGTRGHLRGGCELARCPACVRCRQGAAGLVLCTVDRWPTSRAAPLATTSHPPYKLQLSKCTSLLPKSGFGKHDQGKAGTARVRVLWPGVCQLHSTR